MVERSSVAGNREVFTHSPLLGTVVAVTVERADARLARKVDSLVVAEIDRLEAMLSRHRHDSALERWKRDELTGDDMPHEFAGLLIRARWWATRTNGALDPRAGALTELWRRSAAAGHVPADREVDAARRLLAQPGYEITDDGEVRRVGDCTDLDLHAFGKGWIVDRALRAAQATAPNAAIVVSAGGDIARAGPGDTVIAIDDPFRPYDNAAPVDRVILGRGGLATSGSARRSVEIDGHRFSHIIDPRTGQPAHGAASVSVIADSAEAADAWATALALAGPDEIVPTADAAGVAVMAVLADHSTLANVRWRARRVGESGRVT
ncbi:FAD:protein FMN transferase [Ilumatobacter coccineus]|uniref:FAD:protein FMN transferase n=1 Tax=Ilumatobacter coccineus (strain NBRC 103263 / KCTC 29153 / YM16-304) TaxID=1313172 RepID=A0A6C7EA19_ILUCY|nr:FAD:protein FMN transferase [Ilumatobacter coccineus]BAN00886.1 putative thiamine biosynthesis lipoprotein ApbE [Ilumatobacter coccineus YM16-304]